MDEHYNGRLFSRLMKSYGDRSNTLTWALLIWSFTAVSFALFLPFEATLVRSIGVTGIWSMVHLIYRA
jgi:hypothetical protein